MNKKLYFLSFLMLLVSCQNGSVSSNELVSSSEVDNKLTLEALGEILLNDVARNEILYSSKVEFESENKRGDARKIVSKEIMNIYSDGVSVANGSDKSIITSESEETIVEDKYQRVATTKTYSGQEVFYLVTDYEDGTLNLNWQDSADRLPIYEEGDPNYDGYSYLLKDSLPGQLTKQVSLIVYNFIVSNLLGNGNLQAYMPYAEFESEGTKTTYYLDNFTYDYKDDDGSNVNTSVSFNIVINDGYLSQATTNYKTTTTRGDEVYVEEDSASYKVSYDAKLHSLEGNSYLNVEDYFLAEVNSVKAYIYNDEGDKEYVSLNNLPLEKYIHFEADDYLPVKSVDIEMYPSSSSNNEIIASTGNIFETLASGDATITLESVTGVVISVDVRVNIPEILKIKYDDSSSMIEKEDSKRYIYTSTKYEGNIYVSVNPSAALLSDVEISVSDETVLEVKANYLAKVIELELTVFETDKEEVSITFTSKTNPNIKTTIKYNIKQRLSDEELTNKLLSNTYRWNNLYNSNQYGIMSFTSTSEGKVNYYDNGELIGETTFVYSLDDMTFNIESSDDSLFNYNSGEITLDGKQITLRVDEVTYVHRYIIEE